MRLFKDEKDYIRDQVVDLLRTQIEQEEKNYINERKQIIFTHPIIQPTIQLIKNSNSKIKDEDIEFEFGYGGMLKFEVEENRFNEEGCYSCIYYSSKKLEKFYRGNKSSSDWKYLNDSEILEVTLPLKTPADDDRFGVIEGVVKSIVNNKVKDYQKFTSKRLTELRKILG